LSVDNLGEGKDGRKMSENHNEPGLEMPVRKPVITAGRIIAALVIIAVCTGAYFVYKSYVKKETEYLTMPVSQGSILDKVQGTGTITPLHEVDLYFKQQGTLKQLNVRTGDEVKAGQVLAVQDNSELQAALEQARSNLLLAQYKQEQSKLDLQKAEENWRNQDALYQAGGLAKSEWQQFQRDYTTAQINLKSDQASVQTAQAKVVIAETDLKNAELTAPFAAVAAQVNGEVGQETGNSSSPMFHLISNELKIQVMVNEVDIGRVQLNQDVLFNVSSYPNQPFRGKVSRISPQATTSNNVQLYEVDIATEGLSRQLRAGMSVTANIIINQRANVTVVPNIALSYVRTFQAAQGGVSPAAASSANRVQGTAQYRSNTGSAGPTSSGQMTGPRRPGVGANSAGSSGAGVSPWSEKSNQADRQRRVVVLQDNQPMLKLIKVGMSDNQNTEVISGLKPGDQVIIGNTDSSGSSSSSGSGGQSSNSGQQRMPVGGFGGMHRD